MEHKQYPLLKAFFRVSLFFIAGILPFLIHKWSNPDIKGSSGLIVARNEDIYDAVSNASLVRRDAYSCSASNPCSNGACCGGSGFCGYGPTYCGSGCVSNCGATAECGQYAKKPGTQCPLNTCCSQFGFCGTTEDFCTKGCQSNCVLTPTPPYGGSAIPIVKNKVIGYYESWSASKACHKIAPTNLPLDALTHVNFAFASIEPGSYQIVTMDSVTPSSLFKDTASLKSIKKGLQVWISVGGWSFSDNGTATQPLFGEIAADAGKRQTYANNVVQFMRQYGFDGVDIDWEYPGAPDRGGKPADTQNFVALLKTLRATFDSSGNKYGLTFTAPSSYWYLRWFDLPSMIKYADWINFMTYDLHGVWDATNPIGSVVQGHTNLTEIQSAVALLWRVGVPPAQVVMGFGFYGRSFTLADPSCTGPGCPFQGASIPGPCTDSGGILGYYEILSLVNGGGKNQLDIIHDKVDAVKYFTFDKNQWISYDDQETLKQKTDWADSVGLGGALIWASDLDDDVYTAHSGLLGRDILSTATLQQVEQALSNPQAVIQDLAGSNGQNCFAYEGDCVDLNDNNAMQAACGPGNTVIGWDDAGCGNTNCHCGKPICCPTNQAPQGCTWRGQSNGGLQSDCSSQCAPGETNIKGIYSSWGGGFTNDGDTNKCGRGVKAFCCPNPDAAQVTKGCSYSPCGGDGCGPGETQLFRLTDACWFNTHQNYCCPDPVSLTACRWVGDGSDCANAVCDPTELEIYRGSYGDSQDSCGWGRMRAACCTVQKPPPPPASCSYSICNLGVCSDGDYNTISKRGLLTTAANSSTSFSILDERDGDDKRRAIRANIIGHELYILAMLYPRIGVLFGGGNSIQVLPTLYRLIAGWCTGPTIDSQAVPPGSNPSVQGLETEHPIDVQIAARFLEAATSGLLRNRYPVTNPPAIDGNRVIMEWTQPNSALGSRPPVGFPSGASPASPNDRLMEAFGSNDYYYPLIAADRQVNAAKGNIMNLNDPVNIDQIQRAANDAVRYDSQAHVDEVLSDVRIVFAVFDYMNEPGFVSRLNAVWEQIRTQLGYIDDAWGLPNHHLQSWWDLFTADYFAQIEAAARSYADRAITAALAPYIAARNRNPQVNLQTFPQVEATLEAFYAEINTRIVFPSFSNGRQLPQPPTPPP